MLRFDDESVGTGGAEAGSESDAALLIPDPVPDDGSDCRMNIAFRNGADCDRINTGGVGGVSYADHCHVDPAPNDRRATIQLIIVSFLCFIFMLAEIAGLKLCFYFIFVVGLEHKLISRL